MVAITKVLKTFEKMYELIESIKKLEHGFKHIVVAGDIILSDSSQNYFEVALKLLSDNSYQVKILSTYILRQLSTSNAEALRTLETKI